MGFLAIVIVMVLLQAWGSGGPVQRDAWLFHLHQWVASHIRSPRVRLLVVVAVPVLVLMCLAIVLAPLLYGLGLLALYVVVLLYSMGRGPFNDQIQTYLTAWRAGNFEAALRYLTALGPVLPDSVTDEESLHRAARAAVVYCGFERWFAVVFWFFLLGPFAALVYRLFAVLAASDRVDAGERAQAAQCLYWLEWLPARVLGFTFALIGSFDETFRVLQRNARLNRNTADLLDELAAPTVCVEVEAAAGLTADEVLIERGEKEIAGVQALLFRSVVCWLIVLALFYII